MAQKISTRKVFYTEMSRTSYEWTEFIPGTTQRETVYGTTIIEAQDWADVPENGIYRDRTYKITKCYRANRPDVLGQLVGHSSDPWT
jgi:hypothetical protein